MPPVLLGQLGTDPAKKTLCVYGHLDVQPAAKEDGWDTEPFQLVEKNGQLFGRGATDDKGPVLCWLHAIEALIATGQKIPINIKVRPGGCCSNRRKVLFSKVDKLLTIVFMSG